MQKCVDDYEEKAAIEMRKLIGMPLEKANTRSIMGMGVVNLEPGVAESRKDDEGEVETLSYGDIKAISALYNPTCTYDRWGEELLLQASFECQDCWGRDSSTASRARG